MESGYFITVEGVEGAGKSTAIRHIKKFFALKSVDAIFTREPGGTDNAEKIRELLLSHSLADPHPSTELMLMFASRCEHWHHLILPALNAGKIVVSDRFFDATYAYQGGGRNIDHSEIDKLLEIVMGNNVPDLTILLDVPVSTSVSRIAKRKQLDRIENEDVAFFERVRNTYLELAENNPRFVVIDATQSLHQVKSDITNALKSKIPNLNTSRV